MQPDTVMVFAAGYGTRMGALTANRPKSMIKVLGKPLIDHTLAVVDAAGLSRTFVNTHYLPEPLETHLLNWPGVTTLRETHELLETGGGLRNALPVLSRQVVYTINSDSIWTGDNPLTKLASHWQPDRMEALLLLVPIEQAQEHSGFGDFFMDDDSRLTRRGIRDHAPLVFSGAQIIGTSTLQSIPDRKFSLNVVWDLMLARGSVYGTVHRGGWVDVGRPEGIAVAEDELRKTSDV